MRASTRRATGPLTLAARLICVAGFVAPCARAEGGGPFAKGPYLQDVTPAAAEIRVELASAGPVSVTVTPAKGGKDAGAPITVRDDASLAFHAVRVAGLAPATRYAYVVRAGAAQQEGQLVTAPAATSVDPFTFVVYGDSRTDDVAHAGVVRAILQSPGDFLVNTGDYVQTGDAPALWQTFFDIEGPLLRDHCVFASVGNHELTDGQGTSYLRYFGPTLDAHGEGEAPKLYGSMRWGTTRFFFLDAMEPFDQGPERAWLDDELTRADAEAGLRWRIVVLHQGPWSAGPHGGNPRLAKAGVTDLFARHHVDLILSGHDHIYERGLGQGLRYVVTGGGGAPLYPVEGLLPSTRKVESVHHFVEVTVKPDAVGVVAKRDDGTVIERCGFTHALAAWDCDPAPVSPVAGPAPLAPVPEKSASSRCDVASPGGVTSGGAVWLVAITFAALARARRKRG